MKYYIYLNDSTYSRHGEYILEMFPDNNYKDKWDFYKQCILKNDVYSDSFEEFAQYYDENYDGDMIIVCIDITVDDKIRAYYVDALEKTKHTHSSTAVSRAHNLGIVSNFIDSDNNRNKFERKFGALFYENKIDCHGCGFIIMINKKKFMINNIDHEDINVDVIRDRYEEYSLLEYFKITNAAENHRGFQYVSGLNVLNEPFNEHSSGLDVANGLYFTDAQHIFQFLNYGIYLRKVTLPLPLSCSLDNNDLNVVKVSNGKWRANKIILGQRFELANIETFKYLVELGADIYIDNNNAIRFASKFGYLDIVKYLIQCFKRDDKFAIDTIIQSKQNDAVISAAKYGHINVVKYLVKYGANIQDCDNKALAVSAKNNHIDVVKYLIKLKANVCDNNNKALIGASSNGHIDIVKYLVLAGSEIVSHQHSLIAACERGHAIVAKYLIKMTSPDKKIINNVFINALLNNHLPIVKLLLKNGADIHFNNDLALRLACKKGLLDIVKFLVVSGANIDAANNDAIINAIDNGHDDVVKYLVEMGAIMI